MHKALTSLGLLILPLLGAAAVSKSSAKMNKRWYSSLKKADLTPRDEVFPVVWGILYAFLGLNATLLYLNLGDDIFWDGYFPFFFLQLVLNYTWSYAFFKYKNPSGALLILSAMIVLTVAMTYLSLKVSGLAFILMLVYLLWLIFAYYLNLYIIRNN